MILNEDYFDDIEITDDDIESPEEDTTFKYDKPSDWFANEINGKYSAVLHIPMNTDRNYNGTIQDNYNKWKWIVPYIQKRLYYIFTEYGAEYYNPGHVILEDAVYIFPYGNCYKECMFNDFHDYKIISKTTIGEVSRRHWGIYMPVFFNFPKTQSYRVVCKLISSIIKFLWGDKMSGFMEMQQIFLISQYYQRRLYKKKNRIVNIDDIVNIIHISLGIDTNVIKDKLYANNRELLCKIWKYFYPDLKYLRPKHPKWVDENIGMLNLYL